MNSYKLQFRSVVGFVWMFLLTSIERENNPNGTRFNLNFDEPSHAIPAILCYFDCWHKLNKHENKTLILFE